MEITKSNFDEQFAGIYDNLKTCSFISFDAEFTAILSNDCFKHRLFDSNEERYDKLKTEVGMMIMSQIGLTTFHYDRDRETYNAVGYTFHLCPQVFGDIDQSFIFQASTLKFLCKHEFDFNKFTYEGIPYLSRAEEKSTRTQLQNNSLFNNLTRSLEIDDEKLLQKHCSEVSKWRSQNEGETMYLDCENPIMRYLIHNELRLRFPDLLTTNSLGNSNKILIYRSKEVEGATCISNTVLNEQLMEHLLGFSRVVQLLVEFKKPIIGHNIYLDLILFHSQFIGPLPRRYSEFKSNIHAAFPNVYDTKYISQLMGKQLSIDKVWKSNVLQVLFEFFKEGKCKELQQSMNPVNLLTPFSGQQTYHEAGWDAYCTGYCFVRLGHWAASTVSGVKRPVGPSVMLAALEEFRNKVNVIRGAMPFVNIAGDDPPSHRPSLVYVRSLKGGLNVAHVAALLGGYGSIDVKPYGSKAALVAAYSQVTNDKILRGFRNSKDYKVAIYNYYKHSPVTRMAIWSSALVTGSLVLLLLHKKMIN